MICEVGSWGGSVLTVENGSWEILGDDSEEGMLGGDMGVVAVGVEVSSGFGRVSEGGDCGEANSEGGVVTDGCGGVVVSIWLEGISANGVVGGAGVGVPGGALEVGWRVGGGGGGRGGGGGAASFFPEPLAVRKGGEPKEEEEEDIGDFERERERDRDRDLEESDPEDEPEDLIQHLVLVDIKNKVAH